MSDKITKEEALEALLDPEAVVDKAPEGKGAPEFSELQEKIRSGEVKIEMAPSHHIEDLAGEVQQVLDALGFSHAWVSDMSVVADFPVGEAELEIAYEELGVPISVNDYIYQVAQRVRDSQ